MPRALHTAATGMHAQQLKIDAIANNLANVNTTGFKRSRVEFQDLLYQNIRVSGVNSSSETEIPSGLQIGHGTRAVSTERNFSTGDLVNTENQLDLAIEGSGLFQVRMPGGDIAYTRAGNFKLDSRGQICTGDGYPLEPAIIVPEDAVGITVGSDGLVTATPASRETPIELGKIELANIVNTGAFEAMGRNLYRITGDPGAIKISNPGYDGFGTIAQGFLESSNVRVVEEMIQMIAGQRAYEASSKIIKASDQMLEETNRLR